MSPDPIVSEYYTKLVWANTGINHTLECKEVKVKRNINIDEYETYRLTEDPNKYMLNADPNYTRIRYRKFTVYKDNQGNLRENVQNDLVINDQEVKHLHFR